MDPLPIVNRPSDPKNAKSKRTKQKAGKTKKRRRDDTAQDYESR